MKVAVLCEYSGIVRDAFIRRGHEAISCDLLPTESPGPHIQDDFRNYDWSSYDLVIGHPPCTYLCNSGVRWLRPNGNWNNKRYADMEEGAYLFECILNLPVSKIVVENPIPHKYALELIGRKYDQIIHPWQFGHGETKATCLWLKGVPFLKPTNIVSGREQKVWKMSPSINRWKERSRTYMGIAEALAEQYGDKCENT